MICHRCRGAGVYVTRSDRQGHTLATESCDDCYGTGNTLCVVCEAQPATERDQDRNPLCARCAAAERTVTDARCVCGGRVIAFVDLPGLVACDRCPSIGIERAS